MYLGVLALVIPVPHGLQTGTAVGQKSSKHWDRLASWHAAAGLRTEEDSACMLSHELQHQSKQASGREPHLVANNDLDDGV